MWVMLPEVDTLVNLDSYRRISIRELYDDDGKIVAYAVEAISELSTIVLMEGTKDEARAAIKEIGFCIEQDKNLLGL